MTLSHVKAICRLGALWVWDTRVRGSQSLSHHPPSSRAARSTERHIPGDGAGMVVEQMAGQDRVVASSGQGQVAPGA